jgi:hypothetical protein
METLVLTMDLTCEDRLFYFERQFFTLDGLWITELEDAAGTDVSLAVDLAVWQKLLAIAFRRIKEYLKVDASTIAGILKILEFRWTCEKWNYDASMEGENVAHVTITTCPYKAIMDRNPSRSAMIPRICKEICIPLYNQAISSLNPDVIVERPKCMGLGDDACEFELRAPGADST